MSFSRICGFTKWPAFRKAGPVRAGRTFIASSFYGSEFGGYEADAVPFREGKASGEVRDEPTGFVVGGGQDLVCSRRPVWVTLDKAGMLLAEDEVGDARVVPTLMESTADPSSLFYRASCFASVKLRMNKPLHTFPGALQLFVLSCSFRENRFTLFPEAL